MKVCKICPEEFEPRNTLQQVCSVPCAIILQRGKAEKKKKKETRKMRRAMNEKDRSYQLQKAEEAVNAFRREQDKVAGLPCISCGKFGNKMTAGHYKSVGAHPELRFEELNIHGQCWWNCNKNKSGNIIEYRKGLVKKIGLEKVEWLEGPHEPKNYTLDEIIEIKLRYRKKTKDLRETGNR